MATARKLLGRRQRFFSFPFLLLINWRQFRRTYRKTLKKHFKLVMCGCFCFSPQVTVVSCTFSTPFHSCGVLFVCFAGVFLLVLFWFVFLTSTGDDLCILKEGEPILIFAVPK